jgi:DNA-binding transcriptional LysR family regulator
LLVVLRALLTQRHVTRAAHEVGLSQSATSHALARLRELYADPLLIRSGRSLELTPRAAELLPQLDRGLLELQRSFQAPPAFEPRQAQYSLRIGSADYVQAVLLAPLHALLRAEAPGVNLQCTSFPDLLEPLDSGTADVALTVRTKWPARYREQQLFSEGFACMVRAGHPVLRHQRFTLQRYLELEHLLVAPGGTPGSFVDAELERRGRSRRVALQVSSFLVAPQVIVETDLISTGPQRLLERLRAHYPIVLLPTPLRLPRFDVCLLWHARRDHDPAHSWLRQAIARTARSL